MIVSKIKEKTFMPLSAVYAKQIISLHCFYSKIKIKKQTYIKQV